MKWFVVLAAVAMLWANGRRTRARWQDTSSLEPLSVEEGGADTATDAFVSITGAFCGPSHLEALEREWARRGTVYRYLYPTDLFSMKEAVDEVYDMLCSYDRQHNHREIYLMGYSLGGLISLLVWMCARKKNPALAAKLRLVVHDSPLGFQHLLIPGGMAVPAWLMSAWCWLGRNLWWLLRPGPVLNLIARPFMRLAFPDLPVELQDAGADNDQIRRHRKFLAACRLSLMISKIAAIGATRELAGDEQMPIVVVRCGLDEVVAGDPAAEGWQALFPKAHVIQLGSNSRHISAPENGVSFMQAADSAIGYLKAAYGAK